MTFRPSNDRPVPLFFTTKCILSHRCVSNSVIVTINMAKGRVVDASGMISPCFELEDLFQY
jgi:hypothetical protein